MVGGMEAGAACEEGTLVPGDGHLLIVGRTPDLAAVLRQGPPGA